jgi:antitoxin VapB
VPLPVKRRSVEGRGVDHAAQILQDGFVHLVVGQGLLPLVADQINESEQDPSQHPVASIGVHHDRPVPMDTARLFQSGRSQAVRLPKAYRFSGMKVIVKHFGNGLLLLPVEDPWQTLEAGLAAFEPGFQLSRQQPEQPPRPELKP